MGVPTASRTMVVRSARRRLRAMACQSISLLFREREAVAIEDGARGGGLEVGGEGARGSGIVDDDASLLDGRVGVRGDGPVTAGGADGGGERERQRDDAGIGGAALDELEG